MLPLLQYKMSLVKFLGYLRWDEVNNIRTVKIYQRDFRFVTRTSTEWMNFWFVDFGI